MKIVVLKVYKSILSVPSPSHPSLYEPFHQRLTRGKDTILIQKEVGT